MPTHKQPDKEERHSELAEESRSRQWAARMTPARFLGKLGMTFFLVDYGYLSATAYYCGRDASAARTPDEHDVLGFGLMAKLLQD